MQQNFQLCLILHKDLSKLLSQIKLKYQKSPTNKNSMFTLKKNWPCHRINKICQNMSQPENPALYTLFSSVVLTKQYYYIELTNTDISHHSQTDRIVSQDFPQQMGFTQLTRNCKYLNVPFLEDFKDFQDKDYIMLKTDSLIN